VNSALAILLLMNYSLVGLLPIVFFRRDGRLNFAWLLTALPFFVAWGLTLAAGIGWFVPAWAANPTISFALRVVAIILSAASIGLLGLTVGSHRVPLALWHQQSDDAVELVTWGPYARIRHPFYSSFLMAFLATFLAWPGPTTALLGLYALVALTLTARREERRLGASRFGPEYLAYVQRTGRFLPRLKGDKR